MSLIGIGGVGDLGDGQLAASCVPWPTDQNPDRVICGGIAFGETEFARAWPGEGFIENMPTVHNTLSAQYLIPRSTGTAPGGGASGAGSGGGPEGAALVQDVAAGVPLSPATLVAPMPSIVGVKPGQVSSDQVGVKCQLDGWVHRNPVLALVAIGAAAWAWRKR